MARSVRIVKECETDTHVVYRFGLNDRQMGRLSMRKADGYIEELFPLQHPQSRAILARAMHKLLEHWSQGELPDLTYWLSDDGFRS